MDYFAHFIWLKIHYVDSYVIECKQSIQQTF